MNTEARISNAALEALCQAADEGTLKQPGSLSACPESNRTRVWYTVKTEWYFHLNEDKSECLTGEVNGQTLTASESHAYTAIPIGYFLGEHTSLEGLGELPA